MPLGCSCTFLMLSLHNLYIHNVGQTFSVARRSLQYKSILFEMFVLKILTDLLQI